MKYNQRLKSAFGNSDNELLKLKEGTNLERYAAIKLEKVMKVDNIVYYLKNHKAL